MQSIAQDLRAFVSERFLFGDVSTALGDGDSFLERGIIDSTGVMELVAYIEQQYAIKVADEELIPDNLDSLERLTQFVTRKLEAKGETDDAGRGIPGEHCQAVVR